MQQSWKRGAVGSALRAGSIGRPQRVRASVLTLVAALVTSALPSVAGAEWSHVSLTASATQPYFVCPPRPERLECQLIEDPTVGAGKRGPVQAGAITTSSSGPEASASLEAGAASEAGSTLEADAGTEVSPALYGNGFEGGYSPENLRSAYDLPSTSAGYGQTIAVVDAYDDPNAESDLAVYRREYGIPECKASSGCFHKVNQTGGTSYPAPSKSWAKEISLDLDMVSAICPNCHILLVEATENTDSDFAAAENEAATLGATEISNSFGGNELSEPDEDVEAYDHAGIPIAAAGGDDGYGVSSPASNPNVIAVGGTALTPATNARGWEETVWYHLDEEGVYTGTGSGCSLEAKPAWQKDTGCADRTTNDVAAVADENTPVSAYDSYETADPWRLPGGTSVATPIVAAAMALANAYTRSLPGAEALYDEAAQKGTGALDDVVSGSNGSCGNYLCTAGVGYDGPTGLGSLWGAPNVEPLPWVEPTAATYVSQTQVTLSGAVNPEGLATTYHFEYGTSTSYGTKVPVPDATIGSGTSAVEVNQTIYDLQPATTYHFRLVATNGNGTTDEEDRTFTTASARFITAFGSAGSGAGQFKHPAGVAEDSKGHLWVLDQGNDRVEELNEGGEYLKEFGSKGSGSGQFSSPSALAVDAKGNVWVIDTGNNRVEEFNEKGEYVKAFGSAGSGSGQFKAPEGLAIDSHGDIWVSDTGNGRLQEFNEKDEYARTVGSKGTGAGQIGESKGIAIDSGGNVWVADSSNNRVEEFNEKGEYIREFGTEGSGNGQFENPDAVTIDSRGDAWVADYGNDRVEEFNEKAEYMTQFGMKGSGKGEFSFYPPVGLAPDMKGDIWVTDPENDRIEKWLLPQVYIPNYVYSFGYEGSGIGQFKHPGDVAVDSKGDLWVTDHGNDRVEEFNERGEYLKEFGSEGTKKGQFKAPDALALDSKGDVWVIDSGNDRVQEFNEKGEPVRAFGSSGSGDGQFSDPEGIAVDSHNNIWVSDTENSRIQEFNEKGEFLKAVGKWGEEPGDLYEPEGVVIGPGGDIWVADWRNNRVVEFNEAGEYLREFGSHGSGAGQLDEPYGITLDSSGNVWVGDTGNNRVEEFNERGEYVTQFGTGGSGPGQFSFGYPIGLAMDVKGDVWVTDPGNGRIEKWLLPVLMGQTNEFGAIAEGSYPSDITTGPDGNLWFTEEGVSKVVKITTAGTTTEYSLAAGSGGWGITPGPEGENALWVAEDHSNKIAKVTTSGTVTEFSAAKEGTVWQMTTGPDNNIWFTASASGGASVIGRLTPAGKLTEYHLPLDSFPEGITDAPEQKNALWFTESDRIGKITTSGTVTEYPLPKARYVISIVAGPDGNLWFTAEGTEANSSVVGKISPAGAVTEYMVAAKSYPNNIAVGADGNLWFTEYETKRIGRITTSGTVTEYGLSHHPWDIASGPDDNLWFTEQTKVGALSP
jgi:streptogramin lyase